MEDLEVRPWPSWQVFAKAFKAQFEPLSKEERAREQIRRLVQIGNVNTCIYRFHELQNEIPAMNSERPIACSRMGSVFSCTNLHEQWSS